MAERWWRRAPGAAGSSKGGGGVASRSGSGEARGARVRRDGDRSRSRGIGGGSGASGGLGFRFSGVMGEWGPVWASGLVQLGHGPGRGSSTFFSVSFRF